MAIIEASRCSVHAYIQLLSLSHAIRDAVRGKPQELSFVPAEDNTAEDTEDDLPPPTATALAAIVGPCKRLEKLVLPSRDPIYECGRTEADCAPWVDQAFAGHTALAVLHIHEGRPLMPVMVRILGHLPGLEEFLLDADEGMGLTNPILAALGRCCPRLRALNLRGQGTAALDFSLLGPLAGTLKRLAVPALPLSASLRAFVGALALERLEVATLWPGLAQAAQLGASLTSLTARGTKGLQPSVVGALSFSRLEHLDLLDTSFHHALTEPVVTRMLADSAATLRSVSMDRVILNADGGRALFAALASLPRLVSLDLDAIQAAAPDLGLLGADLLNRLERLTLSSARALASISPSFAGAHLRLLRLSFRMNVLARSLTIHCPALEELSLPRCRSFPGYEARLHCPRLRRLSGMSGQSLDGSDPMPELRALDGEVAPKGSDEPAWLLPLLSASPRLRRLSGVCVSRPETLAKITAMSSLAAIGGLVLVVGRGIDVTGGTLDLRLPPQLQSLWVQLRVPRSGPKAPAPAHPAAKKNKEKEKAPVDLLKNERDEFEVKDVEEDENEDEDEDEDEDEADEEQGEDDDDHEADDVGGPGADDEGEEDEEDEEGDDEDDDDDEDKGNDPPPLCLRVAASTLRELSLEGGRALVSLEVACPSLCMLRFFGAPRLTSFGLAEPAARLRKLEIEDTCPLGGQCFLGFLEGHGGRLEDISIETISQSCMEMWPQLALALGRLPRLRSLALFPTPCPDMVLASPSLRSLAMSLQYDGDEVRLRSLTLDCPLLEELMASFDQNLERFQFAGPGPYLRSITSVEDPSWVERLKEQFPGVRLLNEDEEEVNFGPEDEDF
ncbi:hypothetical protein PAPYR_1765 [Paratrimastix pyriformis]|uniref:Uncharacterized protein n=1 Tax=Paratrimastix pyriformis TaxID=342808 RepID=A0ABQ8UR85_9EUKA|nr:hypothetical protein PAPYR_1765 [Paratrimastix pyriformis]